jgi:hypothetical protein
VAWGRGEVSRIGERDGCRGLGITEWIADGRNRERTELHNLVAAHFIDQLLVARGGFVEVFECPVTAGDATTKQQTNGSDVVEGFH